MSLILVMLLSVSAHAIQIRSITSVPHLSFDGNNASCVIQIVGDKMTDEISATMELRCGSDLIASWNGSGSGILKMTKSAAVKREKPIPWLSIFPWMEQSDPQLLSVPQMAKRWIVKGLQLTPDNLIYFNALPNITGSANTLLYTTVSINQSILNDIQSCNGRVMVLNTISYIDNAAHPAVMGWPTTSIPVPYNATEIVSRVN